MWKFFRCQVCEEKEKRLEALQSEISHLRKLVYPSLQAQHLPILQLEANKILSADENPTYLSDEELKELEALETEASQLLTGNY